MKGSSVCFSLGNSTVLLIIIIFFNSLTCCILIVFSLTFFPLIFLTSLPQLPGVLNSFGLQLSPFGSFKNIVSISNSKVQRALSTFLPFQRTDLLLLEVHNLILQLNFLNHLFNFRDSLDTLKQQEVAEFSSRFAHGSKNFYFLCEYQEEDTLNCQFQDVQCKGKYNQL